MLYGDFGLAPGLSHGHLSIIDFLLRNRAFTIESLAGVKQLLLRVQNILRSSYVAVRLLNKDAAPLSARLISSLVKWKAYRPFEADSGTPISVTRLNDLGAYEW